MATQTTTHMYKGIEIEPCERAKSEHPRRWVIRSYHAATGMIYADELCAHFWSLAAAKAAINERAARPDRD